MRGLHFSFKDYAKAGLILTAASAVMWTFMIRPYSYDWQASGETTGQVQTLMSNSNIMGAASINAVVTLQDGHKAIVQVPLRSNVRAGSSIILSVQTDAENPKRKRYQYTRQE